MLINEIPYDEKKTEPILPFGYGCYTWKYMMKIHKKFPGKTSKQFFKEVFGRQQTCVNYTLRNWIWTFSNEEKTATVYCLITEEGVHWEMDNTSDIKEIVKIRKEVERKLIE